MKNLLFHSLVLMTPALMLGCGTQSQESKPSKVAESQAAPGNVVAEIRAQLSVEDKVLVDAQEWCVVSTSERLGSMGTPIKLDVNGEPVFVCCAGCKRKALADPEKTLAKLTELKEKAKQGKSPGA